MRSIENRYIRESLSQLKTVLQVATGGHLLALQKVVRSKSSILSGVTDATRRPLNANKCKEMRIQGCTHSKALSRRWHVHARRCASA